MTDIDITQLSAEERQRLLLALTSGNTNEELTEDTDLTEELVNANPYIRDLCLEYIRKLSYLTELKPTERKTGKVRQTTEDGKTEYVSTKSPDGKGTLKGYEALAIDAFKQLTDYYGGSVNYVSAFTQLTHIQKELRRLSRTAPYKEDQARLETVIGHFVSTLRVMFAPYRKAMNELYREKVEKRSGDYERIVVDLSPILRKAHQILSMCHDDSFDRQKQFTWEDVSFALALVTGRRMAEIHASGCFLPTDDEYTLAFTGQLKGKGREGGSLDEVVFHIPTLVKAELVLAGLDYLKNFEYRGAPAPRILPRHTDTKAVNVKFSSPISKKRDNWAFYDDSEMEDKFSYHKMRAAYFIAARANAMKGGRDVLNTREFGREILGDADPTTIESYMRFRIAENTLTRM